MAVPLSTASLVPAMGPAVGEIGGLQVRANPPWKCRFPTNCDSRERDRSPSGGRYGLRPFRLWQIT